MLGSFTLPALRTLNRLREERMLCFSRQKRLESLATIITGHFSGQIHGQLDTSPLLRFERGLLVMGLLRIQAN